MLAPRWKVLIFSLVLYQGLLTWCMFELVNISAYFSSSECGEWCYRRPFGFILRNQGAYDAAMALAGFSLLLILVNAAVWISSIWNRRHSKC
ncbi:hypothetical protein [Pannonibacter phragmitetus]|uniref:hypothetical protein n=1 Tax=Pannonibacter phragmitetus TaxID=121719 RepID=UPI003D2EB417